MMVDTCDTLVFRLAEEMWKRHLTIRDVWDTRQADPRLGHCPARPCPFRHRFGVPLLGRGAPFVALEWVTRKDEQERGIWAEQFQYITLTRGAIIQRVMEKQTMHGTHPRRGPSSTATTATPRAAARANTVTIIRSQHRPRPTRRCAGSSLNQFMGNPRTLRGPMPRAGITATINYSPKVNVNTSSATTPSPSSLSPSLGTT